MLEQGGRENALAKQYLEIDIIPVWLEMATAFYKPGQPRVYTLFWAAGLE